jgi:hypothetical protein
MHAALELAGPNLSSHDVGAAGLEDEPALVMELAERLADHRRLTDPVLADDQSGTGAPPPEHRPELRDDRRASAHRRQRRLVGPRLPDPAERPKEREPRAPFSPPLELADGLRRQRALQRGHDVGDELLVRLVDCLLELGRGRPLP